MTDKAIDIALEHVGKWGARADHLARLIYGLIEGDDPEDAAQALIDYGYCDEDGFWKDEE
jgi:hypothetical protein